MLMNQFRFLRGRCNSWLHRDEDGQTLVEYGMLITLLAMTVVFILTVVGKDVVNLFTGLSTHLQNVTP
jgi:Flp pilus assembly pilin Flp